MKIKYALLFVLLFSCYSYAQNSSLFDSYKIPRISFQTLDLSGNNLLNLHNTSYGDDGSENNTLTVDLNLSHRLFIQSPMFTNTTITNLRFLYNKTEAEGNVYPSGTEEIINGSLMVSSSNNWYLNNEKGTFLFFDPGIYVYDNKNTISKNETKRNSYSTSFGAGFGRIINVRNVVQAYIIADELKCNLSDEKLLQLAELLERKSTGEYSAKYKDDADIIFYKDISSITEKPGSEPKIMQILSSSLYQTSMRETGWQAKLGIRYAYNEENNSFADQSPSFSVKRVTKGSDLFSSFYYSLPVDFNKQFSASAEYSLNLNDDWGRMPRLLLSTNFSVDHNYLWSSQISAFYNVSFAKGMENLNNYGFSLYTRLVLLNKLSASAGINYIYQQYFNYSQPGWNPLTEFRTKQKDFSFTIGLSYHIF